LKSFYRPTKFLVSLVLLLSSTSFAEPLTASRPIPKCYSTEGEVLDFNASQIIYWKYNTENEFRSRGHIKGTISKLYPNKTGHTHFEITFKDKGTEDTLELVYNDEFGELPELSIGMTAEACGDYITATETTGNYPPSPDGAIMHWIHQNPSGHGHPDGYVAINGKVFGFLYRGAGKGPVAP
jgi:hypothetical protein